jgi:myo-inositol-hexaphosphate 3-phosphohydrolase
MNPPNLLTPIPLNKLILLTNTPCTSATSNSPAWTNTDEWIALRVGSRRVGRVALIANDRAHEIAHLVDVEPDTQSPERVTDSNHPRAAIPCATNRLHIGHAMAVSTGK